MINHYAFFIQNNHSSSFILKVVPVYDYIDPRVVIDVLSLTVYPTQYGPINPLGHSFYMSIIICIENTCSSPCCSSTIWTSQSSWCPFTTILRIIVIIFPLMCLKLLYKQHKGDTSFRKHWFLCLSIDLYVKEKSKSPFSPIMMTILLKVMSKKLARGWKRMKSLLQLHNYQKPSVLHWQIPTIVMQYNFFLIFYYSRHFPCRFSFKNTRLSVKFNLY